MNQIESTEARRKASVRTGLVLGSIALVFFFGIIASRWLGSPLASIGVVGAAVLLFLVLAIGRHLRGGR
jgi:hypothetical protein